MNAVLACAVVVGVFAVLAVWINRQLLNTDNWTSTSSQLLANAKVQKAVSDLLVNELFNNVDVTKEVKKVLPSEVSALASPATAGLRALAIQLAPAVLATGKVQQAWRVANRTAQQELLRILGGGSKTVSTENGEVVLRLHPLLEQLASQVGLKEQLATVESKVTGASGAVARGTAEAKLGVKLPPTTGNIVILRSSQLKTAQNIAKAIKGLAIVLPLLAIGLMLLAVWMAQGWRRVAVRAVGWCLVLVGLIVLLARRILGDAVVNSLVKVPANKPAAHEAFNIGTTLLFDAAIAVITYGLALVVAAWIGGSTRPAVALRRALAPTLRERPARIYLVAGLFLLLLVIWGPFASTRQPLPVIGIAILLAVGAHMLERMTALEFPDARSGQTATAMRGWLAERRQALTTSRPVLPTSGRIDDLERLARLHDSGALTDAEFEAQKAAVLENGADARER